ncbi:MAG: D-glycero-beta-D-manno-heptose 1,7-bisphosphate 7-phosphatase [Acidiferrobacterales bacterium]
MRLVILDRDGVINYDAEDFITAPEQWVPIPGSLEAIARLRDASYKVAVATNQSGVARGLMSMDTLARIHARMLDAVRAKGGAIDAICVCPHGPDDGCQCRKPAPGLLNEIAARFETDLRGVYAVGDTERDIVAARCAHASPVLVRTGKGMQTLSQSTALDGVPVFDDLAAFVTALLAGELATC